MHGRVLREEGESDRRKRSCRRIRRGRRRRLRRWSSVQHMRSVPTSVTTTTRIVPVKGDSAIVSVSFDSFRKDSRTISVGDCALFKPPQHSPPFIGIIRRLSYGKENNLRLCVNWLYRPAELKLGKGILLDAVPNEIFYSFHTDEIPAASLLHPCRVAFLPQGVELPSGISSFVCRQVYDIANKCLWWLTDQNYINERQEEVDQLLHKTKTEMQGTVKTSGRSPKPTTSTSHSKPGSDCVQNITSFTSQVKGKKREQVDQCSEPMKRERSSKTENGDSNQFKIESNLKSEIAKITEKGGLIDSEGVEKLVHLMQPDKVDKKMDLMCRSILAGVIASTDKFDCLNKFVQLKGLPVLDEWLQDFHKGKISDGISSKDGEKSVEDFLLVLLSALDKLPVNLHALQMCNIGKSVNYLRSYKNWEIQRKARGLVDTWKKRVEAEMNLIDAKSGSSLTVPWSSKSDSHGGNRNSVGSGDIATKSSVIQLAACKITSSKHSPVEPTKSVSSPPGPVRSASSPASTRDSQPRTTVGSASDVTSTTREDKSSGSSQSHNYSQSLSVKEDTKSSSAGSISVLNKVSSGGSRHRKLKNGSLGPSASGLQKQTSSSRNISLQRSSASEKLPHSGSTGEKAADVPFVEGSSHKLIVKIPNRGRSPAQSTSGGSFEDYSIMSSRASSPMLFDKHDHVECNLKERSDGFRANSTPDVNADSCQDVQTRSEDDDGSPAALPSEGRSGTTEDIRKADGVLKAVSASPGNKLKSGQGCGASFCSMNALIESCVKYSETNTSMPHGDDGGMNLLASVAAGEIFKSDLVSPTDSSPRSSPPAEEAGTDDDARSKPSTDLLQDASKPNRETNSDDMKHLPVATTSWPKDEFSQAIHASPGVCGDKKALSSSSEGKVSGESVKCSNSNVADLQTTADHCLEIVEKLDVMKGVTSLLPAGMVKKEREGELDKPLVEVKTVDSNLGVSDAKLAGSSSSVTEVNAILNVEDVKEKAKVTSSNHSFENENRSEVTKGLNNSHSKSPSMVADGEVLVPPNSGKHLVAGNVDEDNVGSADEKGSVELVNESERHKHVIDTSSVPAAEERSVFPGAPALTDQMRDSIGSNDENRKLLVHHSPKSPLKESSAYTSEDIPKHIGVGESKSPGGEAQLGEHSSTIAEASSSCISEAPDSDLKMKFDLNEGLTADDGKCVEQIMMTASVCPSSVQVINSLPLATSSVSSGLPASVTVAAAAKGPFFPPEDLLRSKSELGWKGSAATSAFRPTEPRKVLQTSLSSTTIPPPDAFISKHSRAPLDFDLNVPDERILEGLASRDSGAEICSSSSLSRNEPCASVAGRISGGLDLDLNRTDDTDEMGQLSTGSVRRSEPSIAPVSLQSGRLYSEVQRDFDLNNGPSVDDANAGQSSYNQHGRGSVQAHLPIAGVRLNNTDIGNFSSWFPAGNSYSTMTIPSFLPDRTGAPPKILGPAGTTPFTPDVFRGSVLSSSPAVPFPSTPFQYPVYPFGATFPLSSATPVVGSNSYTNASPGGVLFPPTINSVSMGPVDTLSSQYPRPYMVSLPEGSGVSSGEGNRKWGRPGFDLNAGPGNLDVERREEKFLMVSNQLSLSSSQSLADEQTRICTMGGGALKRKQPNGGRDNESLRYKHSSWQ